jgi:transposase-like protein
MDKKDAAWELYQNGYQQKQIAKVLAVSEHTVVKWKKEAEWDMRLASHKELFESNAQRVQKLISYQLRTLEKIINQWEEEENDKLIGKGEIDALSKLYATIKQKDTAWGNYIKVCKELMEFISSSDLELSKKLADHIDTFLNQKRTDINA